MIDKRLETVLGLRLVYWHRRLRLLNRSILERSVLFPGIQRIPYKVRSNVEAWLSLRQGSRLTLVTRAGVCNLAFAEHSFTSDIYVPVRSVVEWTSILVFLLQYLQ